MINSQKYNYLLDFQNQKYIILGLLATIGVAFLLKIYEMVQANSALSNIFGTSFVYLINILLSSIVCMILTGVLFIIAIPIWIIIRAFSFLLNSVKGDKFSNYLIWKNYFSYTIIVGEILTVLYLIVVLIILDVVEKSFILV